MQNLSKDIAEIARYVLKNIVASKRLPTPLVYKNEFIDAARNLKKDRVLKYIFEDEKTFEQQFSAVLSEARGVLSSIQLSITFFEEENRDILDMLERSVQAIRADFEERCPDASIASLLKEIEALRKTNRQLMESLAETKKDLLEKEDALRDLEYRSQLDPLTQLLSRRSWEKYLKQEFERSRRYGNIFSVILVDIDHFKRFNDFYGYHVGDVILTKFSNLLKETVRNIDAVFRYGGEKFAILLPETPVDKALIVARHILETLNTTPITYEERNLELKVTASFGVADSRGKETPETIVEAADQALYLGKCSGRNCIRAEDSASV